MQVQWGRIDVLKHDMNEEDWVADKGYAYVPFRLVTPRSLPMFLHGGVIDRATAPGDLLADLNLMPNAPYFNSRQPKPVVIVHQPAENEVGCLFVCGSVCLCISVFV
jgi:hypothetical protein